MPAGDVRCTSRPGCSCAVCGAPFDLMDAARQYCTAFSESQQLGSRDYVFMEYDPYEWESDRSKVIAALNDYERIAAGSSASA